MIFNIEPVKLALEQLWALLPHKPKWIGLSDEEGRLIIGIGRLAGYTSNLPSDKGAQQIWQSSEATHRMLEALEHGGFEFSMQRGSKGTMFIANVGNVLSLGVSYHGGGQGCCFESIDAVEATIYDALPLIENALMDSVEETSLQNTDSQPDLDTLDANDEAYVQESIYQLRGFLINSIRTLDAYESSEQDQNQQKDDPDKAANYS